MLLALGCLCALLRSGVWCALLFALYALSLAIAPHERGAHASYSIAPFVLACALPFGAYGIGLALDCLVMSRERPVPSSVARTFRWCGPLALACGLSWFLSPEGGLEHLGLFVRVRDSAAGFPGGFVVLGVACAQVVCVAALAALVLFLLGCLIDAPFAAVEAVSGVRLGISLYALRFMAVLCVCALGLQLIEQALVEALSPEVLARGGP